MKKIKYSRLFLAITFTLLVLFMLNFSIINAQNRPHGVNLTFITDWSQQWMFVDVMKQARPWIVQKPGYGSTHWTWETPGIDIPKRSDGYPLQVPFMVDTSSYVVHTLMLRDLKYPAPTGNYSLIFEGTGSIRLNFDAEDRIYSTPDSLYSFSNNPVGLGIHLTILSSDINDPNHNIRVIMPGFENTYISQPFHPKFIELLQDFKVVRFLQPQEVNRVEIVSPTEMTPVNYYTQVRDGNNGLAYEYIAKLCNMVKSDPWVCIPHKANDSLVARIAKIMKDSLETERKIYLEYSNEVWSQGFPYILANQYAQQQGTALGLSSDAYDASLLYYTLRALQIFDIFDSVFMGDNSRIVKVLASQSYLRTGEVVLGALNNPAVNPKNIKADALAVGTYFGYRTADNIGDEGLINTITVSDILDSLEITLAKEINYIVSSFKILADSFGLSLISYEGGQHLTGLDYMEDTTLTRKLNEANRHPRMKQIYCDFFDLWYNSGGGLFNFFDFAGNYNKYGSFGIIEHLYQNVQTAPKWMARQECLFDSLVRIKSDYPIFTDIKVYPNPSSGVLTFFDINPDSKTLTITDVLGKQALKTTIYQSNISISTGNLGSGIYFYHFIDNNRKIICKGKFIVNK